MISLDPDVGEYGEADIPIEDGEIVEVGTGLSASNVDEIVASDHVVVLGFVDSRIHPA
ncbi:hypothetical protein ABNG02_00125 [Halorubrum ejinorense]|uniref:Uncharacterized protein n=1 Tax=Halorubrum ejinorense TaxID=425309 RepID=A0AAV3STF2_9EURY